jgi:hypothetical protein
MHEMNFRIPFWGSRSRMDVKTTKIPTIIESFIDGQVSKVLVPEGHHLAFSHKSGKLVLAS